MSTPKHKYIHCVVQSIINLCANVTGSAYCLFFIVLFKKRLVCHSRRVYLLNNNHTNQSATVTRNGVIRVLVPCTRISKARKFIEFISSALC